MRTVRSFLHLLVLACVLPACGDEPATDERAGGESVVGRIEVLGLARVTPREVRDRLSTRPGRPLLEDDLVRDAERIAELHRQQGYPYVQVTPQRRATGAASAEDVVFSVVVGHRQPASE